MQNGVKKINSLCNVSNNLKIRSSVIEQIIKTEKEYVKTLNFLANVMKSSLERCTEQIEYEIEDGHVRALFGNVTDLLDVHKVLLKELEKEVGKHSNDLLEYTPEERTQNLCRCCLGRVFLDAKETFKVYDIYCSNHSRAEEVAEEILKMTSLQNVIKKWNEDLPFSKESMQGANTLIFCLKLPLLHLCRLSTLLKVLAVFTSANLTNLQDVLEAHSIVQASVTSIDPAKRAKLLQEAYDAYQDLQTEWDNQGLLNKQGFLTKRGGSIKSWKIRWFTLRSYEMKYFDEPVDEKSLGTLNLRDCSKVFETDSQSKPNCFGLTLPDRTYFIYATTPSEMLEWMNLIAWKLYMLHSAEEKARLALSVPALGRTSSVLALLHII